MSNDVMIPKAHYVELLAAQEMLSQLEAIGVDNWEGYEELDWGAIDAAGAPWESS